MSTEELKRLRRNGINPISKKRARTLKKRGEYVAFDRDWGGWFWIPTIRSYDENEYPYQ